MQKLNLLDDPVERLFFRYLAPSISATLVTSVYILADTLMIGRGVGAIGIAALNILLPLFSLFYGTGMLFGVGGGVLLSFSKGRQDDRGAKEYFTAALFMAAVMSLCYVVLFHVFFGPVTAFLGRNDTMEAYVNEYGRILVSGSPVFLTSAFLQAFVRNDKAPKTSMAAVIAGGVTNVILDYIFIFPMGMWMAGAAAASVIGSLLSVGILATHFFTAGNTLKAVRHFQVKRIAEVTVSGLASFLLEMSNGIVTFLFNRQLLVYVGDLGVVVYGIICNSSLIVSSVSNGIAQAVQPLAAVNYGAGKWNRLKKTKRLGELAALLGGFLFAAVGLLFPAAVTEAFVAPDAGILAMSVPAVRIYFSSFVFMGINILYSTWFQSIMKPGYSLFLCMLRGLVLNSILVFVLPLLFGVTGIWAVMPVTELFTLAAGIFLVRKMQVRISGS